MKRIAVNCLVILSFFAASVEAANIKSLLISIEKYELAPLDYAKNDIGNLATLLMARYDCQAQACIDTAATGYESPKSSIENKIRSWCELLLPRDTAILYLAGHGVKDDNGRLYLAMTDFNRQNHDAAAIPLDWIRDQFEKSDAKNKLLLIDTCFAGTNKSIDFEQATIDEVNASFSNMKSVVTVASCQGDEKSWLWGDAKHSLFTYWLIEGLKGHADRDGNQQVALDELVQYLQENVAWVARKALEKEQHPVILNAAVGKEFHLPLRAVSFQEMVEDLAEQINLQMRLENFSCVGIPEFTTGHADKFEPEYGALPRWAAESLRRTLVRKSKTNNSRYDVLAETALQELLQSKGITPNDLGTEKTKNLSVDGNEIPLIVRARMSFFSSAGLAVQAELLNTQGKVEVAQVGGSALLNSKEMALCGLSGKFSIAGNSSVSSPPSTTPTPTSPTPSISTSSATTPNANAQPDADSTEPSQAESLDSTDLTHDAVHGLVSELQRAETAQVERERTQLHPMADPNCPFKVAFETRPAGSNRSYTFRNCTIEGNQCFLVVNQGEEYAIRIRNESSNPIFARILVDGLNTLSQPMTMIAKGAFVEEVGNGATGGNGGQNAIGNTNAGTTSGTYQLAPRVDLDSARPWILRPNGSYQIAGFVDANMQADALYRFQVVDADESVAARANYTDQIGTITIAFFEATQPYSGARGIGTGAGSAEAVRIEGYRGSLVPGNMLVVMNTRYMSPNSFKTLQLANPVKSQPIKQQQQQPVRRTRR